MKKKKTVKKTIQEKTIEIPMQFCSNCGKELIDSQGNNWMAGMFNMPDADIKVDPEFCQKQMGKYPMDKLYRWCWECHLDSIFGRLINYKQSGGIFN